MRYLLLELIYYSAEMKNVISSNTSNCSNMCSHNRGGPKERRKQEQESYIQKKLGSLNAYSSVSLKKSGKSWSTSKS